MTVRISGGPPLAALLLAAILSCPGAVPASSAQERELRSYRVTEHAPVIQGRPDKAYQRALEGSFRKAFLAALRDTGFTERQNPDSAAWLSGILGRAGDYIASYRILSHQESEGFLTLSLEAQVYLGKIRSAVSDSSRLRSLLPVKLLVLVHTFPLAGAPGGEDIDAGSLAAGALEAEFLHRGAIVVPAPESLPWAHLGGRVTAENVAALSAAEGRRHEADYVVLGHLQRKADNLLVLTARLLSVDTEKTLLSVGSPVELQTGQAPEEFFLTPAGEIAQRFERRLTVTSPRR